MGTETRVYGENSDENLKLQEEKRASENKPNIGFSPFPFSNCQHCYCGHGAWNSKEHIVCCICGHRTLANPVSF